MPAINVTAAENKFFTFENARAAKEDNYLLILDEGEERKVLAMFVPGYWYSYTVGDAAAPKEAVNG